MNTLAMFPGQGSQYVGMGKSLLEQFPYASRIFEEAEDAAKLSIRNLCLQGPQEDLQLTANTQPCILTMSIAVWTVLKEEVGFDPQYFAGHSLGEYSALVAAEILSLTDAVLLVRRRGEAMQKAVPKGVGAMAAVMSVPAEELESMCERLSAENNIVEVVNYNSPQQIVVAGHKKAVESLESELAKEKKRCVILPVSAPFHSSLMAPAREEMTPLLNEAALHSTVKSIFANLSGNIADNYQADYLIRQIDSPVKWTQIIEGAKDKSIARYVEVGPGKVLWGLARRILPRNSAELLATDGDELLNTLKVLG